jgi:hypothetical protein
VVPDKRKILLEKPYSGRDVAEVIELLPPKCEALNSKLSTSRKKKLPQ